MKGKKVISLIISICMLLTFIPLEAMADRGVDAIVTFIDRHANEYAIMYGDVEIESGDHVPFGTELKIVPTEMAPEGYVINGFWLYSYDGTDEIHDKIEGDSFIVTKDLEVYDVELSYLIGENEGDIWLYDNYFYIWESTDIDESGIIDYIDFLEFYNSENFGLEPHIQDYYHTITSHNTAINSNIYAVQEYCDLYFGDLNLGTGGVYGYSYEIEEYEETYTYYPEINLNKGNLSANDIIGENYIWVDKEMQVYIKNDFVGDYISSYGGVIVVGGDITAPGIWFDSDDAPFYVTVGGNINTIQFDHEGGFVHVKNNIISEYNEELFGMDFDNHGQPYINVETYYADFNSTQLIVDGDIKTGETGYVDIGDEEGYYGPFMMNSFNVANESANKPRKNKDNKSDNRMMLAYDEEEVDLYVETYVGGNIEAGREIYIYNGTVIAGGSIKTTNKESHKTLFIYGGNVSCNEMYSIAGIEIYDNPMGTTVNVTGDMTAEHSIYMFRNPYLYGDNEYDNDTPGFIEVNVGGDIISADEVMISDDSFIPMFIEVNANNIRSESGITVFGGLAYDLMSINQFLTKVNVVGDISAKYMVRLDNSHVFVGGSINTRETGEDSKELFVGLVGSNVRCGSIRSSADIFIEDLKGFETYVFIEGNMTADDEIDIMGGKIYASGISAVNNIFIDDDATLFDANNDSEIIIPTNWEYDLYRTRLTGLVPNATVEIEIYNEKYDDFDDPIKTFTTDADKYGNIYVWLLGDDTEGAAYYGDFETMVTSPTAISSDAAEIDFRPLDAKLANISINIPDCIFNFDLLNPWSHYEDDENPLNPVNWIFEYEGDTIEGFPEELEDYDLVFTRNGQLYDISHIGGFFAGDYKVTVSIEDEIDGETYIAVGVDEFTIEPWMINIKADDKKVLLGSEIGEDFFTLTYSDNAGLIEEMEIEFEEMFGELFGEFNAICYGNTDKVEVYPIYVKVSNYNNYTNFLRFISDNSFQLILETGEFTVYEESPEEPRDRPSTTYYTITATAGEGGNIAPHGSIRVARRTDKTFEITPDEGYEIKDVLVDGVSVGKVDSYTFENVTKHATIEALFSPVEPEEWANPFDDVNEDNWFYQAVEFCVKKGIFTGMTESSFKPDTHVTRAMFVTILGRLYGINPADYSTQVFDDVELGQWYSPYVQWALENEIVKGYDEKTFGPNDKITREQMCSIIVRYCEFAQLELEGLIDEAKFEDDALISSWAREYVKKSQMANLIQGIGNNMFNPLGSASRAEAAVILMRLIQNIIE